MLKNSFSGEPFTQQNFRKSYRYEHLFVALFILTQPEQLSRFLRKSRVFEDDGLWARIVFHLTQSNNPNGEFSLGEARKGYSEVIFSIIQMEYNNSACHQIALNNEAYGLAKEYEMKKEHKFTMSLRFLAYLRMLDLKPYDQRLSYSLSLNM